jgi:hypothetical protein
MFSRLWVRKTLPSESYCRPVRGDNKLNLPPASTGFIFALLFCPEDGGNMFLREFRLSPNYTAILWLRRQCSLNHKWINTNLLYSFETAVKCFLGDKYTRLWHPACHARLPRRGLYFISDFLLRKSPPLDRNRCFNSRFSGIFSTHSVKIKNNNNNHHHHSKNNNNISIQLRPSLAANSWLAQDIQSILWNQNVRYIIHQSWPEVFILSQINPVHIPYPVSLKSLLIPLLQSATRSSF